MNFLAHFPHFYRNNPYSHQNNLPDSAFHNRKMPSYQSQLPQGDSAFEPSHKRHFQRIGYHSIIGEQNLINNLSQEQTQSPAKDRQYFRNLNINDIEGTSTNTLISQGVKNRMKARELVKRKQEQNFKESCKKQRYLSAQENQEKRQEALRLMSKANIYQNYHQKTKKMKTESAETNFHNQTKQRADIRIDRFRNQLTQVEKNIDELRQKLGEFNNNATGYRKQFLSLIHNNVQQEVNNKIEEPIVLPSINQYQSKNKSSLLLQKQQNENSPFKKSSYQIMPNKKRSNTQPNDYDSKIYPSYDKVIQNDQSNIRDQRQQISDNEEKIKWSQARRRQIRKLNPTYLSYGCFNAANNKNHVYI